MITNGRFHWRSWCVCSHLHSAGCLITSQKEELRFQVDIEQSHTRPQNRFCVCWFHVGILNQGRQNFWSEHWKSHAWLVLGSDDDRLVSFRIMLCEFRELQMMTTTAALSYSPWISEAREYPVSSVYTKCPSLLDILCLQCPSYCLGFCLSVHFLWRSWHRVLMPQRDRSSTLGRSHEVTRRVRTQRRLGWIYGRTTLCSLPT